MVGHNDRHLMLGVQICAVRQLHRDIAGLADGHCTAGDGALRVRADDLDGQRPAVAVRVLIASSDLAVLVGLTAAGGDGDLTCLVGLARNELSRTFYQKNKQQYYLLHYACCVCHLAV